ncbi:SDR family NAD(P)-dependent oxidoreductase [Leptobacterium flavescens]|uniref:SDR family NAD(P)-dependent oxidoreductase n=1 Tax=Leptobacterium flavescens TaxID=472055 RepID=A0A6P0UT80_9FLAO|nr:SDR family NAD(P)-dependent oxidoreductase [Leptobacterium flavescens]NER15039.1 SDR family NAD(P)-dependent oxidoreductase [Leptobacterium flavescens]
MKKTVLITGASQGIGLALAKKFLQNDYQVIGTSRNGEVHGITDKAFQAYKLDLTQNNSIQSFKDLLISKDLQIDLLINNAGIGPDLNHMLPEEESLRTTFETNLFGTIFLTEALIPLLNDSAKLINISSKMGAIGPCVSSCSPAYRMSKTALNMYTKLLTNRFSGKYKVAVIHPGWVRTMISGDDTSGRLSPEESAEGIFDFVISNFRNGMFWDVETRSEIEW